MKNFDKTMMALLAPRSRRVLLTTAALAPLCAGLWSQQAAAQVPALAPAPKALANWAALQQLAKGQAMQPSPSLRLAAPAVAAAGDMVVTIGSEIPGTTLLALFVQTEGLLLRAPLTPAQAAQPPVLSAEQMRLRSVVAVFDCSHLDTKPEFSLPVKFERTSRFYLVAIAADVPYLVEAEAKLALQQRQ